MIDLSEKRRDQLTGPPQTIRYEEDAYQYAYYEFSRRPLFGLWVAELMEKDSRVGFGLSICNAPLFSAEVEVTGPREVAEFVERQFRRIWEHYAERILRTKIAGYGGFEVCYQEDDAGLLEFRELLDLHPRDTRPLTLDGVLSGVRVKNSKMARASGPNGQDLLYMKALWLTYRARYGSFYGYSALENAYAAWWDKNTEGGAGDLVRLRMMKDAWTGDVLYYMQGQHAMQANGNQIPLRKMAQDMAAKRASGGVLIAPMVVGQNGQPLKLIEYTPPTSIQGATQILEWIEKLDWAVLDGLNCPREVVEAAATGSGFSGRSIPFASFLSVRDSEFASYVREIDWQILRRLVAANFGWQAAQEYEIRPVKLLETVGKQMGDFGQPNMQSGGPPQQGDGGAGGLANLLGGPDDGGDAAEQFAVKPARGQASLNWDEQKHPRESDGQFAPKGGGSVRSDDDDGGFSLGNDKAKRSAGTIDDGGKQRQKTLLSGLDALAGQQDLFDDMDKEPEEPEGEPAPPTPASVHARSLFDDADPREAAAAATEAAKAEYAFARKSAVSNAGEDLTGSARHKANSWRGLAQAEQDGTAEKLVTRDMLLKNEPPDLMRHIDEDEGRAMSALAAHLALQKFPPKPGYKGRSDADATKTRRQYLAAYQRIKAAAERLAGESNDPTAVLRGLQDEARAVLRELRGEKPGALNEGADKYNATANGLIDFVTLNGVSRFGQKQRSTAVQLGRFLAAEEEKNGKRETAQRWPDLVKHARDVLDGMSFDETFGVQKEPGGPREKKWTAADMYVGTAQRTGGRENGKTAQQATAHMLQKHGMRGVQFGNWVTDAEREHHAIKAAEALLDLADVTGLDDKAVGFNGTLGLAMGARGTGRALAHYEPSGKNINLTRTGGVGSLAHEWAHFFDNMLAGGASDAFTSRSLPPKYVWQRNESGELVRKPKDLTPVQSAMHDLQDAMRSSGFYQDMSRALSNMRQRGVISEKTAKYYSDPAEMLARCFERHVQHKLREQGRENTYLSGFGAAGAKQSLTADAKALWPSDEHAAKLAPAFDALFAAHRDGGADKPHVEPAAPPEQFAAEERWITIGGNKSAPKGEKGGTPVNVRGGKIVAGPEGLKGKHLSKIADRDTGRLATAVREHAKHWRVNKRDLLDAANEVYQQKREAHEMREAAKKKVRETTGLTQQDVSRLANSGRDHTAVPGFDAAARAIAAEFPELGLGPGVTEEGGYDDTDYAAAVWQLLAEGKRELPARHSPELLDEAAALAVEHKRWKRMQRMQEAEAVPFAADDSGPGSGASQDVLAQAKAVNSTVAAEVRRRLGKLLGKA